MACIHPPTLKLLQIMLATQGYFFFVFIGEYWVCRSCHNRKESKIACGVRKETAGHKPRNRLRWPCVFGVWSVTTMITKCHPQKNQCSAFCCGRNELLASILCKVSFILWSITSTKMHLLDRTRSDLTFAYFTPINCIKGNGCHCKNSHSRSSSSPPRKNWIFMFL